MITEPLKPLFVAAAIAAASQVAAAPISVDGSLTSADNYQASFSLGLELDQLCHDGGGKSKGKGKSKDGSCGAASDFEPGDDSDAFDADMTRFSGELHLGWGDGATRDLFMAFVLPTEIQDMTWGDNASTGYRDPDQGAFDKLTGSEYFSFDYEGDEIKVGMDDADDVDDPIRYAATSLDWNRDLFPELTRRGASSPACGTAAIQNAPLGDGTGGTATWQQKDADCYSNPAAGYEDWEFRHIYEVRLDGSIFADLTRDLDGLFDISSIISTISVHASDPKRGGGHGFTIACLAGPRVDCNPLHPPGNPPPVPPEPPALPIAEPGLPVTLLTCIAAMLLASKRRRKGVLAAFRQ